MLNYTHAILLKFFDCKQPELIQRPELLKQKYSPSKIRIEGYFKIFIRVKIILGFINDFLGIVNDFSY